MKNITSTISVAIVALLLSGCASVNFTPYRSSEILQGKGGSIRVVKGIDFWENGVPDQKYKIIGIIDYKGKDKPIQNVSKDGKIAKKCKQYGGDGVILIEANREFEGTLYSGAPFGTVSGAAIHKNIIKYQVIKYIN